MSATIYALQHPITHEVRYVGKTNDCCERRQQHIADAKANRSKNKRLGRWIRKLLADGLEPELRRLVVVPETEFPYFEKACIALYRHINGKRLINVLDGGDQPPSNVGRKHSDATKAKQRAAKVGRPLSLEHRAKISAANAGKPKPVGFGEKISASQKGKRKHTDEARANMSIARRGRRHSSATRFRMSEAHRGNTYSVGRNLTDEHKAKIAERHRGNKYGLGKSHSSEARERIAAALRGRKRPPDVIAKIRATKAGKRLGILPSE